MNEKHTFIPQEPIPVTHFALPSLGQVKDADTEPNIVKNTICVFFVELRYESLFWGYPEIRWVDSYRVLSGRVKISWQGLNISGWYLED